MFSEERRLASAAYKGGQLNEAVDLCQRGVARTQAIEDHDEHWRLRSILALCICEQGNFREAIEILEGVPAGKSVSIETRARVLNQKGFCLSRSGNFAKAKECLDAATSLAIESKSREILSEVQINRSTLFFFLAKYDEVETCGRLALEIGEELKLPLVRASACASIGKSLMYRDRQADAIPWFERALVLYQEEGASGYADIMRGELGCCHFALQENDRAFEYFNRALQASRESAAFASLHIDLANMGCLLLRRREVAAAISHFQEALQIARNLGDEISVSKWLHNLAAAYSQMGNPALSEGFQREAKQVGERVNLARACVTTELI